MTTVTPASTATEIEAARLLLARLGVTPEQLLAGPVVRREAAPTFTEYIDRVSLAVSSGTCRVYDSYWRRLREQWGHRRLDEPTPWRSGSCASTYAQTWWYAATPAAAGPPPNT